MPQAERFHCMNLPTSKERDGFIGITDFRGDLIRIFRDAGWIYHPGGLHLGKDPVTPCSARRRSGCCNKQIKERLVHVAPGHADYLVTMRKPGVNPVPVTHTGTGDDMPVELWQRYASPGGWTSTRRTPCSTRAPASTGRQRHICPLQLQVIERAMTLEQARRSGPFAVHWHRFGGHVALKMGRRFVGAELSAAISSRPGATSRRRPQIDLFHAARSATSVPA